MSRSKKQKAQRKRKQEQRRKETLETLRYIEVQTHRLKDRALFGRRAGLAAVYRADPTASEARFTQSLRSLEQHGYSFVRSVGVGPYIADFLCKKKHVAIELDGWSHEGRGAYDARRDRYFLDNGIRTIRIASHLAITDPGGALAALRNALGLPRIEMYQRVASQSPLRHARPENVMARQLTGPGE